MPAAPAPIEPHETLFVVNRKRFFPVSNEEGVQELVLQQNKSRRWVRRSIPEF